MSINKLKLKNTLIMVITVIFSLVVVLIALSMRSFNVKFINHRGYSAYAPENTLTAYKQSHKMGYKYVECDVDFTLDGIPVLIHDSTVDRTSNAKTGENIREITFEKARSYDFGYPDKFGNEFKGEKIPSFSEFINLCVELDLHPYIEMKNQSGINAYTTANVQTLVDIVNQYGILDNVTWISFNFEVLQKIKSIDKTARLGYLNNKITPEAVNKTLSLKTGENEVFLNVNFGYLTNSKVRLCKKAGIPLEVWTVNSNVILKQLDAYVSGVTTDSILPN